MNILKDLGSNSAVELGEGYLVRLSSGRYEVGGKEIWVKWPSIECQVGSLEDVLRIDGGHPYTEKYIDPAGNELSVEQYDALGQQFEAYFDDDYGEYSFPTPELEMQYVQVKHYKNSFRPVEAKTEVTKTPVKFEVVGSLEDTGSDFISSPLSLGNASGGGVYRVETGMIAMDALLKCRSQLPAKTALDIPTHSNIHFAKVDGSYIFTNQSQDYIKNPKAAKVVTSLEEAREIEQAVRKHVTSVVRMATDEEILDEVGYQHYYQFLSKLNGQLEELEVKTKSEAFKESLIKALSEEVANIEKRYGE